MTEVSGFSKLSYLQDVSSETEETSKASGGADSGAVGGTGESWLGWLWSTGSGWSTRWSNGDWSLGWDNWCWGGDLWDGGVDVDWSRWLDLTRIKMSADCTVEILAGWQNVPGGADDNWGDIHWLGDGAWAVGDGQRGGLWFCQSRFTAFCCAARRSDS